VGYLGVQRSGLYFIMLTCLAGVLYAMLFGIVRLESIGFVFSGNVEHAGAFPKLRDVLDRKGRRGGIQWRG